MEARWRASDTGATERTQPSLASAQSAMRVTSGVTRLAAAAADASWP